MRCMKLLIVDDSELIRGRLASFFQGVADVDTAATLAETLDAVGRCPHELLILDLHLPDGNAMEIIPSLKQLAPAMRIAVLTNDASTYNSQRCLRAGAAWFFDKSTEFEKVLRLVREQVTPH